MVRLASKDYIPVTGDDWYQRRRDDAEGRFFRKVADQGRRVTDDSTRQGIYCFTASGKLLAFKNAQDAEVMKDTLRRALAAWKRLPQDETAPGAVKVEDLPRTDSRYTRTPPDGGLIVTVHTRILDEDSRGRLEHGTCETPGGDRAARDHLWLTQREWQSLIPAQPKTGEVRAMPAGIARRIARSHLVDNTRGEPPFWTAEQVRELRMEMTVLEATDKVIRMSVQGKVLLATDAEVKRAERGFAATLVGEIRYDRANEAIDRFDLVAVGDHWGKGPFTGGARPGRKPLGVAFELSRGDKPGDRVPPQAARDWSDYLGR
jgi:hypothetical protein